MRIGLIIYGDLETMTGGFLYDRMMVNTLREQGDTVEVLSLPWLPYGPALFLNASLSLIKRLKNGSFDLVLEDELVHPSFFILNTGLRSLIKCPIIAVVHHLRSHEERPDWQNRFYGIVEKRFLRTVDGFIFNSRATLNTVIPWAKKTGHRWSPIRAGIDSALPSPKKNLLPGYEEAARSSCSLSAP